MHAKETKSSDAPDSAVESRGAKAMLDLIHLSSLMDRSHGRPEIVVGLIDGPVAIDHPDLAAAMFREIPGKLNSRCLRRETPACAHATLVAGILIARRESVAPAICPGCTLMLRPIFAETMDSSGQAPSSTPDDLAEAIVECVDGGVRVINLSSALVQSSPKGERALNDALQYAANRGVISVAAAGNQGRVASSAITRHAGVIPVTACSIRGTQLSMSNLGSSIGLRGLSAPGDNITSLGTDGKPRRFGGTSAAAPFVTGTIALLWSEFPSASAAQIKLALKQGGMPRRGAIAPPLLNAWAAYQMMASAHGRREMS